SKIMARISFLICLKVAKVSPIIIMKVKEKTNWRFRPVCLQSESSLRGAFFCFS
ncbi:IS5/IS1182 family transposase, partial [Streptococcus dysgalactiae]|nr:IS5/IS1182 family transposase [Streptococcus dysgalactiae]